MRMDSNYYETFDFEGVLENLCSDDNTSLESNSNGEEIVTPKSTPIIPKSRRKFLRIDQNGNKRSKVFEVDGSIVAFEARFPKPRVLYTDIRRCYANMYVNAVNSHDFHLLYGFLDTFCTPRTCAVQRKETSVRPSKMSVEKGLFEMGRKLYARMKIAPDTIMNISDVKIISYSGTKETKIITKLSMTCTELFDRPRPAERESMARRGRDTIMRGENTPQNVINTIMSTIDCRTVVMKDKLTTDTAVGEFIMYLDEDKRITKIEKNFKVL